MHTAYVRPAPNTPKRRLIQRRQQTDRRMFLRWYPHGEDRRYKPSRRQNDRWETMKAMLSSLFPTQDNLGSIGRRKKRSQ
jgi:hypothetical protein